MAKGYAYFLENFRNWKFTDIKAQKKNKTILINGSEAIGFGAIAGGCQFIAAYPMSPSTGVFTYITGKAKEFNIISEQAEDEIASIGNCIGASFVGIKSMTATSGPGLDLMTELIGLASMSEIPVVIVDVQRGGPSTGMPTKHDQSDLFAACFGTHGDTPKIVIAASNAFNNCRRKYS